MTGGHDVILIQGGFLFISLYEHNHIYIGYWTSLLVKYYTTSIFYVIVINKKMLIKIIANSAYKIITNHPVVKK